MAERPADAILPVLAKAAKPLRLDAIAAAAHIDYSQAASSAGVLVRRGLAERTDQHGAPVNGRGVGYYRATAAGRDAATNGKRITTGPSQGQHTGRRTPETGTLRERAWKALRKLQKATVADIVRLVAEGEERDPEQNVRVYLRALVASGHVTVLPRREPLAYASPGLKKFLLVRNTGPKAPVHHRRRREVYDPNTQETHHV